MISNELKNHVFYPPHNGPPEVNPGRDPAARWKIFEILIFPIQKLMIFIQNIDILMFFQPNFTPIWDSDVLITIRICWDVGRFCSGSWEVFFGGLGSISNYLGKYWYRYKIPQGPMSVFDAFIDTGFLKNSHEIGTVLSWTPSTSSFSGNEYVFEYGHRYSNSRMIESHIISLIWKIQ